jgi:predicted ATPase
LEGIPLAIELAAAHANVLSSEQIRTRLSQRFQLLTSRRRAAPQRQLTMRATLEWSYDLLTETERTLFNRLSVFAGGFTLDAFEAVCAVNAVHAVQALETLTCLVDKSLAIADSSGNLAGVTAHPISMV